MGKLKKELVKKLERIPGLEDRPSIAAAGSAVAAGSAIFYHGKEIAHFHNDNEIDVQTKKVIKREGLSHPSDSKIHRLRGPHSQMD